MPDMLIETADLTQAEVLWRRQVPAETVFDSWEVRLAFHRHYRRPLRFLTDKETGGDLVFLPLCWVEEKGAWCMFPGETWANKTWLEQNRLRVGGLDRDGLRRTLGGDFHLRYLVPDPARQALLDVDETGYLFHPPACRYDMATWWAGFKPRHAKALRREVAALLGQGLSVRPGGLTDYEKLVQLNIDRFASTSYFADPRFRDGFREMLAFLSDAGALRVTVVERDGSPVAVDVGSVYRDRYTLLAGGTHAGFPGVAKLINLHHLEWACAARVAEVDFLCGDFLWKPLFRLTPRPLYLFTSLI